MKKCMLIALITVFALVSFGVLCFADSLRGVANTSKKGSLLIFPLIKVGLGEQDSNDTIITISNDYPARVNLKCRYQTPESCYCDTFSFALTGNQPISFRAETGEGLDGNEILPKNIKVDRFPTAGGQYAGELRCWAVGASGQPISYNWLSGTATVVEGDNQTWEYSAWRFQVGYGVNLNQTVGDGSGTLRLTGLPTTYDACPESLIFNFVEQVESPASTTPYGAANAENRVTLVPCKQDCATSGTPIRARFQVYNEYEADDEAIACYNCSDNATAFFSKSLSDGAKFRDPSNLVPGTEVFTDLGTPGGMAIVTFLPYQSICGATYGVPMVGVISNKFSSPTGPVAGETLTVLGRGQPELTNADGSKSGIEVIMTYEK